MIFGIENVYTVSETLCSVKEWLRESVAEASSIDFEPQTTNLDELNVSRLDRHQSHCKYESNNYGRKGIVSYLLILVAVLGA